MFDQTAHSVHDRKLTWVLSSESRASVIIVEHVGGEGSLEFVPVGILDHFFLGLFLLLLLGLAFGRAA